MGRRIKYYWLLKQIHLISSIILFSFVFIFLITGIVVVNRNLFEDPQTEMVYKKVPVDKSIIESPEEFADYLKRNFGFKGRETINQQKNGNWVYNFNFQGKNHQVTLPPAQDTLHIRSNIQEMTLLSVSTKLHHMRGFKGGWEYTLWAVFYELTAISLIVFAVTGILMWFKTKLRYQSGWWFLIAGMAIPVMFVFLFLYWR